MNHLLDLGVSKEKVKEKKTAPSTVANPSKSFEKRLGSLAGDLRSINGKLDSLTPGPGFDTCLAQHLAESIGELKAELVDITRGLSLLESDDTVLF